MVFTSYLLLLSSVEATMFQSIKDYFYIYQIVVFLSIAATIFQSIKDYFYNIYQSFVFCVHPLQLQCSNKSETISLIFSRDLQFFHPLQLKCFNQSETISILSVLAIWYSSVAAIIGSLFRTELEAAFSNMKMWNSVGLMAAFLYSDMLCTRLQVIINLVAWLLALLGYLAAESPMRRRRRMRTYEEASTREEVPTL